MTGEFDSYYDDGAGPSELNFDISPTRGEDETWEQYCNRLVDLDAVEDGILSDLSELAQEGVPLV